MDPDVLMRRATPDDAAVIADIHARSHRETYAPILGAGYEPPHAWTAAAAWRSRLASDCEVQLAFAGDRPAGFGAASGDVIGALYVLADRQGCGIGRALLARLLAGMRARGVAEATFNVLAANTRAVGFYEAMGARVVGTERTPGDPACEDLICVIATEPTAVVS